MLFTSQKVLGSACYRVMRNADLDIDEDEAEDLLKEIEEQVRKRRYGEIIRLEVEDDIDPDILDYIITELKISKDDIFRVGGPVDLTFLSKVNGLVGKDRYRALSDESEGSRTKGDQIHDTEECLLRRRIPNLEGGIRGLLSSCSKDRGDHADHGGSFSDL